MSEGVAGPAVTVAESLPDDDLDSDHTCLLTVQRA